MIEIFVEQLTFSFMDTHDSRQMWFPWFYENMTEEEVNEFLD
jgi:hypothetical protein